MGRRAGKARVRIQILREKIPLAIQNRNVDSARRLIAEYEALCDDHRFAEEAKAFPDQAREEHLRRIRQAIQTHDFRLVRRLCREQWTQEPTGDRCVRRLRLAAALLPVWIVIRYMTFGAPALYVMYLLSAALVFRAAGRRCTKRYSSIFRLAVSFATKRSCVALWNSTRGYGECRISIPKSLRSLPRSSR